jgi:superfamily II DNA or RNA helicase
MQQSITLNQKKELRDYQKTVIADYFDKIDLGYKSILLFAPTGAGKTLMSANIIADYLEKGKTVLFLVHRIPLIEQTLNTLYDLLGGVLPITIYQGVNTVINKNAQIMVGTVQSVKENKLPIHVDLVVFDEVHMTIGFKLIRTIQKKYQPITALAKTHFLGLTATPYRGKRKEGFCWLFQDMVKAPLMIDLVRLGYLTPLTMYGYGKIDDSKLKTVDGEFTTESIEIYCNEHLNDDVVEKYLDKVNGKKFIAFCSSVKQAQHLLMRFQEMAIPSALWVGDTKPKERVLIQKRLKDGEILGIVSVNCLSEGFDEPSVEVALVATITRVVSKFIQMTGRVLRLSEGKTDAILFDFGGHHTRFKGETPLDIGSEKSRYPLSLCPPPKLEEREPPTKECSNCHAIIYAILMECPHCGHDFPRKETEHIKPPTEFKLILSKEEKKQIKFLHQKIRAIYRLLEDSYSIKNKDNLEILNPVLSKKLFYNKYDFFPKKEWYRNAIFKDDSQENKSKYAKYLLWAYPNFKAKDIIDILSYEFGEKKD